MQINVPWRIKQVSNLSELPAILQAKRCENRPAKTAVVSADAEGGHHMPQQYQQVFCRGHCGSYGTVNFRRNLRCVDCGVPNPYRIAKRNVQTQTKPVSNNITKSTSSDTSSTSSDTTKSTSSTNFMDCNWTDLTIYNLIYFAFISITEFKCSNITGSGWKIKGT